jgi:hypothetical protein
MQACRGSSIVVIDAACAAVGNRHGRPVTSGVGSSQSRDCRMLGVYSVQSG